MSRVTPLWRQALLGTVVNWLVALGAVMFAVGLLGSSVASANVLRITTQEIALKTQGEAVRQCEAKVAKFSRSVPWKANTFFTCAYRPLSEVRDNCTAQNRHVRALLIANGQCPLRYGVVVPTTTTVGRRRFKGRHTYWFAGTCRFGKIGFTPITQHCDVAQLVKDTVHK